MWLLVYFSDQNSSEKKPSFTDWKIVHFINQRFNQVSFQKQKDKKIWLQILIMSFILSFSLINNHLTRKIFYAVNNVTGTGAKGVFFLKLWNLFCKMSENQEQLLHFSYFLSKVKPTETEKRQGKPNGACGHWEVKIIR